MTTFAGQLEYFVRFAEQRSRDAFVESTVQVQHFVVDGSELTGAPGQPVDTGFLRGSWIGDFVDENTWRLTTNVGYAPVIEHGEREAHDPNGVPRPAELKSTREPGAGGSKKSTVGGRHSIKHTVAGWPRIVEYVTRPGNQVTP